MFMLSEVFFFLAFLEDLHHITCMNVICHNIQWTKLYNLEIRESLPLPPHRPARPNESLGLPCGLQGDVWIPLSGK